MKKLLLLFLWVWTAQTQAADHDLSIVRWLAPQSAGDLNDTEIVRFEIENLGTMEEGNFKVAYSLNGGTTFIEETYEGVIPVGAKRTHSFATRANLSKDGDTYQFVGKIILSSDENPTNNEFNISVVNKINGDDCSDPIIMNLSPGITYTDKRDITPFCDDYGTNSGWGAPNYLQDREVFYQFQTSSLYSYLDVKLKSNYPTGGFYPKVAVHVINNCPEGQFMTMSSGFGTGNYDAEFSNAYLYNAQTYYVVVSKWTTYNFTYDLEVTMYEQTDFKSFGFKNLESSADIDYTNHTITLTVPQGTDLTTLVPEFETPSYADAWIGDIMQTSGSNTVDFSNEVTYSVIKTSNTSLAQDWKITAKEDVANNIAPSTMDDIEVFPNPFTSDITLNIPSSAKQKNTKIQIINYAGSLVDVIELKNGNKPNLNLAHLTSGIYFLVIDIDGQQTIKKVVKY